MSYLGMLCLGLFVGGVIGLIMAEDSELSANNKTFSAIFGAAIGGGIGAFIQFVDAPIRDAVYAYPMGLVLGFIWPFVKPSWKLVRPKGGSKKHPFAALHVAALFLTSVATFLFVMHPKMRGMLDPVPAAG